MVLESRQRADFRPFGITQLQAGSAGEELTACVQDLLRVRFHVELRGLDLVDRSYESVIGSNACVNRLRAQARCPRYGRCMHRGDTDGACTGATGGRRANGYSPSLAPWPAQPG